MYFAENEFPQRKGSLMNRNDNETTPRSIAKVLNLEFVRQNMDQRPACRITSQL